MPISDTQSEADRQALRFFGAGDDRLPAAMRGGQFQRVAQRNLTGSRGKPPLQGGQVNVQSQHFARNAAGFFGNEFKESDAGSERGSIFQHNAARFYEMDEPGPGEKPFRVEKQGEVGAAAQRSVSVLNEQRLKEHVRYLL